MKTETKDRIKLMTILIGLLAPIIFVSYFTFAPKKVGSIITTKTKIIEKSNTELIEIMTRRKEGYAFKGEENGVQLLEVYIPSTEGFEKGKYDIDKKNYDALELSKDYWFKIKFFKPGDTDTGVIKEVYNGDPLQK
jgi:hypothetical protein